MNRSMSVPAARSHRHGAILVSIALGCTLVPLNSTMVAVALPEIMKEFKIDTGAASWLVTSYLITMATLQLVAGKFGDQLGRRRLVLANLIYFGFASLLAALSTHLSLLLIARVQQAIAGAMLITNGIALAFEIVPEERRGSDLGWVNAVIILGAASGPPIGGLLVRLGGWQAIFWANIPLVISAFILGRLSIPVDRPHTHRPHFTNSILHLQLIQPKTFLFANLAIALSNLATYVILLIIPILLSYRTNWTSLHTGLVLAAMSVAMAIFSPLGGRLSDRYGKRLPNLIGLTFLTIALLPLVVLGDVIQITILFMCLALVGTGTGLCSVSLQAAALESVKQDQAGIASGISSTSRYLGSIIGSSIISGFFVTEHAENFRLIFLFTLFAAISALIASFGVRNRVPENVSGIEVGNLTLHKSPDL